MYLCVRVRVCVWGRRSWEEREKKEIRTRKEREEKRKNKETGEKRKHKLIHTDKQTNRQTDEQTDRQIDRKTQIIHWYEIIISLEYDSSLTSFWSKMYES